MDQLNYFFIIINDNRTAMTKIDLCKKKKLITDTLNVSLRNTY